MLKVCEGVRARHTEDGGILLDVRQGHMFRLNPVGSLILSWLEAGFEESRITEELSRKFSIDRAIAQTDVLEFLELLRKQDLLEVRPSHQNV
jgi:hypothetical protein